MRFFPDHASARPPARARSRPASRTRGALRRLVAAAIFVLLVGAVVPTAGATTSAEQAVHSMINEARANNGRKPLSLSAKLSRIARSHSKQMATSGTLFHSCLQCRIGGGRRLGENVGFGIDHVSVQADLMASGPHRANILERKFRRVGVGIVRRGGLAWVTQIFFG